MNRITIYRLLLIFFLLPLFFLNVKDSHDWGDDFAQYLIQARNVIEHRPQTENGLLQNENDPAYAIEAYPMGIPLLITPVFYFSGLKIFPYCILFSLVLFITGIISFEFFRRKSNELVALIITILFCYNAATLELKKQILSELPFTCLMLLILWWIESKSSAKKYSWLITGILLAAVVSTRLAGVSIVAGFIIYELKNIYFETNQEKRNKIIRLLYSIATSFFIFILLNRILFQINPGKLFTFYSHAFSEYQLQINGNLNFYYDVSKYIFPFFGRWIPSVWIILCVTGWIIRFTRKQSLMEFIFLFYSIIILFYPYSNAGLRFLIPVLPLLIYYLWYFFNWLLSLAEASSKWVSTGLLLIIFTGYINPIKNIISHKDSIEVGPYQQAAVQLFNYIKSTPGSSAIVFCKARAMSLYTDHPTLYTTKNVKNEIAFSQFHRYKNLYLVIGKVPNDHEIFDPTLLGYLKAYEDAYEKVWENEMYGVYRQL